MPALETRGFFYSRNFININLWEPAMPQSALPLGSFETAEIRREPNKLPRILEVDEFAEVFSQKNVLAIDVRSLKTCIDGHIPGAVMLDYSQLLRSEGPATGMLPSIEQLSSLFSTLGLRHDTHVLAYDDDNGSHAARLLWTLESVGHQKYSLLNGGFAAWDEAAYPITDKPALPSPTIYSARLNPSTTADFDYLRVNITNPDTVILDTRSAAEFHGRDVRANNGGHIPNAIHFEWSSCVDLLDNGRLLDTETVSYRLNQLGVTPDKEILVYCQSHHRSSHTYLVLKHLGYPRVRAYPGSWSEWGNRDNVPVHQ
jgi:thiosulfate/3-mercaptopyruvate sulfurtransferase